MTDVFLVRYEIVAGAADRVRSFFREAEGGEMEEVLRAEDMLTESAFVRETPDGAELYLYQEAQDMDRVLEAFTESSNPAVERAAEFFADTLRDGLLEPAEVIPAVGHFVGPDR